MKRKFGQHLDPIFNQIQLGPTLLNTSMSFWLVLDLWRSLAEISGLCWGILGAQSDVRSREGWHGMGHTERIGTKLPILRL